MDYFEILDYLFTKLPIYQRQGPAAYKADLANTHEIMKMLGHPERGLTCIHVAGTNGKGSVSHMLASVLQEHGYKTGLYTSPHLKDFRERIRIDGKMIDQDEVVSFVEEFRDTWQNFKPSFFEITVGMAFWYFRKSEIEIAIIETGLGGRLDSTNVVTPEVSVITNIGMDHTQFLGNTIDDIAREKGGIIKDEVPLVLGAMAEEAESVLRSMADRKKAKVFSSESVSGDLPPSDLKGSFQEENKRTVMMALKVLKSAGWKLEFSRILDGFAKVAENTGIQGRWHQLGEHPLILADGGHNCEGLSRVIEELEEVNHGQLHMVLGVVGDKSIVEILKLLPKSANYYFCKADIPRGMPADTLRQMAFEFGLKGEDYPSVRRAFEAARLYAANEDTIFVGGSFFTVAEVL